MYNSKTVDFREQLVNTFLSKEPTKNLCPRRKNALQKMFQQFMDRNFLTAISGFVIRGLFEVRLYKKTESEYVS